MRPLFSFFLSFLFLLSSSSASPSSSLRSLLVDQVYPLETSVYAEFDDGWYHGYISGFDPNSGWYQITFEDGDVRQYENGEELIAMIHDAKRHPYNEITEKEKEDEQEEEEEEEEEDEIEDLQHDNEEPAASQLVPQRYPLETRVYKVFDDGWYLGKITAFDDRTGIYTIRYKDGDEEEYDITSSLEELAQMVSDAAPPQRHPIGVAVYKYFEEDDEWYSGVITEYHADEDSYTIMYENDPEDTEIIQDGPELDTIIDADYDIYKDKREEEDEEDDDMEDVEDGE